MQKDQWRAIRRGKLFKEAFNFITEDHFKPIPGKKQLCDEEYIKEYSEQYFWVCYESFAGPDGRVMFTDNIRVAVSAMVRAELANYGWEFDYEEVIDVQINEDLIQALIQLFPDAAELAGDIAQFHWFSKGEKDPYQNSKAQHIANSNTVRVFEEAIDFHYSDAFREIDTSNAFDNTIPTEKEVERGNTFWREQYNMLSLQKRFVVTSCLRTMKMSSSAPTLSSTGIIKSKNIVN